MTSTSSVFAFVLLSVITLLGALAAVGLRNLVHSALCLALTFVSVGGIYLLLGAEFIGFVQLLVYVGAVAVLIVFVILLTRPGEDANPRPARSFVSLLPGAGVALGVFAVLAACIYASPSFRTGPDGPAEAPIEAIGEFLVSTHIVPLQITGVMLTAALIGGVLFATKTRDDD